MTRASAFLLQHLLTRSDLARMEVPAAKILVWLAEGWLDQVGRMPDDEVLGDPVFTVPSSELRHELLSGLASIGKPAVVLTHLRVRSFLMRALLLRKETIEPVTRAAESEPTEALTAHQFESDLAQVLQETAEELDTDVEQIQQLAEQEAQLEAAEFTSLATSNVIADARDDPAVLGHDGEGGVDDEGCFDAADLADELDSWGSDQAQRPAPETSPGETSSGPAFSTTTTMTETSEGSSAFEPPASTVADPAGVLARTAGVAEVLDSTSTPPVVDPSSSPVAGDDATDATTISRVETFLSELKHALVEMAQRPPSPNVDVGPLVEVVQSGFERSAQQSSAANAALVSLVERLGEIGHGVETGVTNAVRGAIANTAQPTERVTTEFIVTRDERLPVVLLAITVLVVCWSIVFWFKTGSPKLAMGTLIGANVVGCCLLAWRRNHG